MKTIVITGGTSGFGEVTTRAFARSAENRLILGSRGRVPEGITSHAADVDVLPVSSAPTWTPGPSTGTS